MHLYLIAMESEAKDLIKDAKLIFNKPFALYELDNNLIAITRIGKVNAAFTLSYLNNKYDIKR